MKVNKHSQVKSQKWKDVRGRRCRPALSSAHIDSSELLTSSPLGPAPLGPAPLGAGRLKEPQRKPAVKRLKNKARAVGESRPPSSSQTNGRPPPGPVAAAEEEEEDWRDWRELAASLHGNGVEGEEAGRRAARLEGDALQQAVHRDDRHNRALLLLQKDQTLCFRGKCLLTCVYGCVEVLGFCVEAGHQSHALFSPASHSPLTITGLEGPAHCRDPAPLLYQDLPPGWRKLVRKTSSSSSLSSLVLLEPLESPLTRFLSSFHHLEQLFSPTVAELPWAVLDSPLNGLGLVPLGGGVEGMKISQSCRDTLDSLLSSCTGDSEGPAVILVYGAKNAGKSTFNRLLINRLLHHSPVVDYVEADVGQTEFTPPGCLSVSSITEPLLGPPFSHQRSPGHMTYYGQLTCEPDPDRYLDSLKTLWRRRRRSNQEAPTIINTMGWVKGLGLQLLVDLLRLLPVSHVVQVCHGGVLQSSSLTPDFLRSAEGFQTRRAAPAALDSFTEGHAPPRSYAHFLVHSEFQGAGRQGTAKHQRSNEIRELSLLGFLSQLQDSEPEPGPVRPLHCLTPYQVSSSCVALGVLHCEVAPPHLLYAANGGLVALCVLGEKVGGARGGRGGPVLLPRPPVCPCLGFGVLRGVDVSRGIYFLLTSLDPEVLRKVNCLLLGEIALPSVLLTEQVGMEAEPPYVTSDYTFDVTGAGKLRVFKGLMRPSQTQ